MHFSFYSGCIRWGADIKDRAQSVSEWQDCHGPHVSAGSQPSERALPLSSRADPHIYNPAPTAAETFSCLGPRPGPLHHLTPPLSTSTTVPVVTGLLRGLLLSCYPHITACREEGRDKGMRGREGKGRGGICAAPTKRRLLER
ncbi:hypothetical protein Q5P01_025345 [Channa striata]|uniref:Uncharacterized protein n=1 Tax=Channa striata TaxID=64152 RepID=A0AA88LI48_CHASR|nr:hypothetical protein Q5P01_025345 [Channa striata]